MSLQNKQPLLSAASSFPVLRWSRLASAVMLGLYASCLATTGYAMESIDDQTMSETTGADGIAVNVQATQVAMSHAYWLDPTTSETTGNLMDLQGVSVTNNANPTGSSTGSPFFMTTQINAGSDGTTTPALSLNLNLSTPTLLTATSIVLCGDITGGVPCSQTPTTASPTLGSAAVQLLNSSTSTSPLTASLVTTNGFLNSSGTATVRLLLNNGNIFFTSNGTQLITSDIYANISATGRLWVDATDGFRFSTNAASGSLVTGGGVTLSAPYASNAPGSWSGSQPINAGIQFSLVGQTPTTQTGVTANAMSSTATQGAFATTVTNSGLTMGVSGNLSTLNLTVRGASASGVSTDGVGGTVGGTASKSIVGSAGGGNAIALSMSGTLQTGGSTVVAPVNTTVAATNPPASVGTVTTNNTIAAGDVSTGGVPIVIPTTVTKTLTTTNTSTPGYLSSPAANSFMLYLGVAGDKGYGIQMADFVPFSNVSATDINPTFSIGNVYMNLLTSSTTALILPVPSALTGGTAASSTVGNTANYFGMTGDSASGQDLQNISVPASGGSLFFAVRGLSIQGVPLITSFYQNGNGVCTGTTTCSTGAAPVAGFAIIPVLNNVNANVTLNASTATSLAYSLAVAMTDNNGGTTETGKTPATDIQESAFFLADTVNKQYVGLRDINLYMKADGVLTLSGTATTNKINLTMPHFMLAASAGLAAGYLPGAEPTGAPLFTANKDTLLTMNLGLQSDATNNANNFSVSVDSSKPSTGIFAANLTLAGTAQSTTGITNAQICSVAGVSLSNCTAQGGTISTAPTTTAFIIPIQSSATGNFYRIVDNGGSALGLDNITGALSLSSQLGVGPVTSPYSPYSTTTSNTPVDSATLATTLQINPNNQKGGELLTTLNFYPSISAGGNGTSQTIGKMVLTGGTIISNLTLTPVTH